MQSQILSVERKSHFCFGHPVYVLHYSLQMKRYIENLQYYLKRGRVSNKMRSENILVIFLKKLQNLPSRATDLILLLSLKGLKLTKIHEIISFTQTNFAEKFINTTTKLRAGTSSKVLKSMWKFFNNVLFVSIKKYLE